MIGTGASRDPVRPGDPAEGRAAAPVPAHARPGCCPRPDRRIPRIATGGCTARLPVTQRAAAAGDLLVPRARSWCRSAHPAVMRPAQTPGAPAPGQQQVADPALRAKLTPDYRMGCKRILLSNDYCPRWRKPNVEVVTDGHPRGARPTRSSTATAPSARSTRSSSAPASAPTDPPIARARPRPRRAHARRGLATAARKAHPGTTVAGFPNLFMLLGPEHRPRPQLGRLHDRGADRAPARRAALHASARGDGARAARPRRRRRFVDDGRRRMRGTVWTDRRLRELVPRRHRAATRRSGRDRAGASTGACRVSGRPTTSRLPTRLCRSEPPRSRCCSSLVVPHVPSGSCPFG